MKENLVIARIRENIRKEISLAGYRTIELFSHEHGIDKSTLSRVLNAQREPRVSTLIKICQALDIPVSRLFGESPSYAMVADRPRKRYTVK